MAPSVYNDDDLLDRSRHEARAWDVSPAEFVLARLAEETGGTVTEQRRAECDALRRIVELHDADAHICRDEAILGSGAAYRSDDWADGPCLTLRLVAGLYADHPDFRQEWRP